MDDVSAALDGAVSGAAFRRLLMTGGAVPVAAVASDLDRPEQEIAEAVEDLKGEGRIRLDEQGRIMGAAGLSIGGRPAPHRARWPDVLDLVRVRHPRHRRRAAG
ncbi:MAG TPA: hypothetical protein VKI99_01555 [Candidatus Dormibacteraeota bacterium]|nr:hypothetical protein [Candidatus Dormibacteraeota bacterium]